MINYSAILISGPTASGKTSLAIKIAKKYNGVVVNADSMQVYKDLSIITARPNEMQTFGIPHYLYGFVESNVRFSVGDWISEVQKLLVKIEDANQLPIIVGGTGLYFDGLFGYISDIPSINDEIRKKWQDIKSNKGLEYIQNFLNRNDPKVMHILNKNDTSRLIRAVEVFDQTGKSIIDWQKDTGKNLFYKKNLIRFYINPDKQIVDQNIKDRTDNMLSDPHLLDEIKNLKDMNISPSYPIMKAIGVQDVFDYLEGKKSIDDIRDTINLKTKRYSKRQLTWARKKMTDWNWLESGKDALNSI
tara:strand:- start:220 stop:1125 length:906 start_codon:yes stop_codon:yes gene_type:complete